MRPRDEVLVGEQLRSAIRDLQELESVLLELMACDDQPVEPLLGFVNFKPYDPVHTKVWKVSTNVMTIARTAHHSLNAARQVLSRTPEGERTARAIPDCLACGERCVGRVRAGFCSSCDHKYRRRDKSVLPDRAAFIRYMGGALGAHGMTRDDNVNEDGV